MEGDLDRVCGYCQAAHPSEAFLSEWMICLNAPELEPYLDDILDRQDFSRCRALVERIRFSRDRHACDDFDPIEDTGEELSPALSETLAQVADAGRLTVETLRLALLDDAWRRTDWSQAPVDGYVKALHEARSPEARLRAVSPLRLFVGEGNRQAFDALSGYLRDLPPTASSEDKDLRIQILDTLAVARAYAGELASLLVEDLLRTPSNNTTRGWYAAVFTYLERRCPPEAAEAALRPALDSPHFSRRIRGRIRTLLQDCTGR